MTDDLLIERAIRAHTRHARQHGRTADQPAYACSTVNRDRITLANANGVLAEYRVGRARLIRLPH